MHQVTIKQIAQMAGVSRGTVDRALNHRSGIKPEVKERILKIANELNYEPNILAKALVSAHEKTKIGIILTPEHNPFVAEIEQGITRATKEYAPFGIEVETKTLYSLNPIEQLAMIDFFVDTGASGIGLIPLDDDRVRNRLNELSNKGFAIITFNSRIENIDQLCFIGQNHISGGICAGGLMGRLIPPSSKVAVIISAESLVCHQDRLAGFRQKLADKYPSIQIVEVIENQDRDDLANYIGKRLISKHPDLKGIYITGGGISGLAEAIKETNHNGKIRIVSHDFVNNTKELLTEGILDFAIGQNPEKQGYLVVSTLFDYLIKNQPPAESTIDIEVEIATEDYLQ